jgi:hypothetical protein
MISIIFSFLRFVTLFIGTGFVAGSIVHLGEGVNPWDVSLLIVGVALFTLGALFQERANGSVNIQAHGLVQFLLLSLLLSVGIGMASGGMQHFVDTPEYSAILIPLGFALGFFAYCYKEAADISRRQWWALVLVSWLCIGVIAMVLQLVIPYLPEPQGHHDEQSTIIPQQQILEQKDDYGH